MPLLTEHGDFIVAKITVIGRNVPDFFDFKLGKGVGICGRHLLPTLAERSLAADANAPAIRATEPFVDFNIGLKMVGSWVRGEVVIIEQKRGDIFKAASCSVFALLPDAALKFLNKRSQNKVVLYF